MNLAKCLTLASKEILAIKELYRSISPSAIARLGAVYADYYSEKRLWSPLTLAMTVTVGLFYVYLIRWNLNISYSRMVIAPYYIL